MYTKAGRPRLLGATESQINVLTFSFLLNEFPVRAQGGAQGPEQANQQLGHNLSLFYFIWVQG